MNVRVANEFWNTKLLIVVVFIWSVNALRAHKDQKSWKKEDFIAEVD